MKIATFFILVISASAFAQTSTPEASQPKAPYKKGSVDHKKKLLKKVEASQEEKAKKEKDATK